MFLRAQSQFVDREKSGTRNGVMSAELAGSVDAKAKAEMENAILLLTATRSET